MANPTSTALPLADIHLQAAPGFWPLPWGWWLVLIFVLGSVLFFLIYLYRYIRKNRAKKEALRQFNKHPSLANINLLLKKTALHYYNRKQVAGLTGHDWLTFLDRQLPANKQGFVEHQALWLKGVFSNDNLTLQEIDTCKKLAKTWLEDALPPKTSQANSPNKKEAHNV